MKLMSLRDARLRKRLTQDELAVIAGLDQATISRLETDPDANPTAKTIRRLADALGIAPSSLQFPEPHATVRRGGDRVGPDRKGRSSRRAVA